MASGPSTFTTSYVILSSASPAGNLVMLSIKSLTDSFLTTICPSLLRAMVWKTVLSAKQVFSRFASAVFIPVNILLITVFTESSAVWDLADAAQITVNRMRKYFMMLYFMSLWQMN